MAISLLDMIIQNRGGSAPGPGASPLSALLSTPSQGQQAPEPEPLPQPSGGPSPDFLSRILGTAGSPGLAPDQREQVRRQGVISAGLGTLMADPSQGTLPRLAQGVAAGRQVSAQMRQKFQQENAEQVRALQMMQIFGEGPLSREGIRRGIRLAAIRGDNDTVDSLRGVLDSMPEEPTDEGMELVNLQGVGTYLMDDDNNLYDPFTKERVNVPPQPGDEEDPFDGAFVETVYGSGVTPQVARMAVQEGLVENEAGLEQIAQQGLLVRFDKAGEPIAILGTASAPDPEGPGEGAGQARVLRRNLDRLNRIIDENGVPNRLEWHSPNEVLPAWVQQYRAAAGNIEINAARAMFGARVSDSEREALAEILTPRPGDNEDTIRQKMNNLEQLVADFERQAGIFDPNITEEEKAQELRQFGVNPEDTASLDLRTGDFGFGGGQ